jgi:hypothetical protein
MRKICNLFRFVKGKFGINLLSLLTCYAQRRYINCFRHPPTIGFIEIFIIKFRNNLLIAELILITQTNPSYTCHVCLNNSTVWTRNIFKAQKFSHLLFGNETTLKQQHINPFHTSRSIAVDYLDCSSSRFVMNASLLIIIF